jgi:hypothetical protein
MTRLDLEYGSLPCLHCLGSHARILHKTVRKDRLIINFGEASDGSILQAVWMILSRPGPRTGTVSLRTHTAGAIRPRTDLTNQRSSSLRRLKMLASVVPESLVYLLLTIIPQCGATVSLRSAQCWVLSLGFLTRAHEAS